MLKYEVTAPTRKFQDNFLHTGMEAWTQTCWHIQEHGRVVNEVVNAALDWSMQQGSAGKQILCLNIFLILLTTFLLHLGWCNGQCHSVPLDGRLQGEWVGRRTGFLSERGENKELWAVHKYSAEYEVVQAAQTPLRKGHR